MAVVAVLFDFDDTLMPDSTSEFLRVHDLDPQRFYRESVDKLVKAGFDPTHAFLKKFLDSVGKDKPFGELTNQALRQFGATLDNRFFSGIPDIFDDLSERVKAYRDISVEYYILSGGLQDIIEGSTVVAKYFPERVYGCQLGSDREDGVLNSIKRAITFTEKTRYLFEISKGFTPEQALEEPYIVNKDVPVESRRIPFNNMIYVGDGLTDVPCFSLIRGKDRRGGTAFAVFQPDNEASAKQAYKDYLKAGRVDSAFAPEYGKSAALGSMIRTAVVTKCNEIKLGENEPKRK